MMPAVSGETTPSMRRRRAAAARSGRGRASRRCRCRRGRACAARGRWRCRRSRRRDGPSCRGRSLLPWRHRMGRGGRDGPAEAGPGGCCCGGGGDHRLRSIVAQRPGGSGSGRGRDAAGLRVRRPRPAASSGTASTVGSSRSTSRGSITPGAEVLRRLGAAGDAEAQALRAACRRRSGRRRSRRGTRRPSRRRRAPPRGRRARGRAAARSSLATCAKQPSARS